MTRRVSYLWIAIVLASAAPVRAAAPRRTASAGATTSRVASTVESLEGIERVDRALLPRLAGPVTLRVHAIDGLIVVDAPKAGPALIHALRRSPLSLCPDVEETPTGATLRCRSRRIVAHLDQTGAGYSLDVAETRGLPWDGEDGAPIVPFDPVHGIGTEESAALRRGDLAFAQGDVLTATSHWSRARGRTWEKLAAARLCELSWTCLGTSRLEDVYASPDLPEWAQRDLRLRHARALAFLGRPGQAAEVITSSAPALFACASARSLCRDIAGAALADPGPRSLDALALWLSSPDSVPSATSYQATAAAAAVAEREGAPIFAANLLASTAGEIPKRLLREHLLRTAELYLAGGDLVRTGVVVEFARTRPGEKPLGGPRWAAVLLAMRAGRTVSQGHAP